MNLCMVCVRIGRVGHIDPESQSKSYEQCRLTNDLLQWLMLLCFHTQRLVLTPALTRYKRKFYIPCLSILFVTHLLHIICLIVIIWSALFPFVLFFILTDNWNWVFLLSQMFFIFFPVSFSISQLEKKEFESCVFALTCIFSPTFLLVCLSLSHIFQLLEIQGFHYVVLSIKHFGLARQKSFC